MSAFNQNIYLLGFMGCGKSTLSRMLSVHLGWKLADTDTLAELKAGMTVSGIFEHYSEAYFRALELQALHEVAVLEKYIVALGGGTPIREEVWPLLQKSGKTIYIQRSPVALAKLLRFATDRPLLKGAGDDLEGFIADLLAQRESWYKRADVVLACEHTWDKEKTFAALVDCVKGIL